MTRFASLRLLLLASTALVAIFLLSAARSAQGASLADTIRQVQPKIVKIYGAGGFHGMEPYQSGFLISGDGYLLTAFSYVLDTDSINATLHDGRKFEAKLVGADPRLEVAVLKIDASDLPHFDLAGAVTVDHGARVLAFSNLFGVATGDEPASVQDGVVAAKTTLDARRGVFQTTYRGPVYVIDAITNNPGAAGGALVTHRGELVGALGKELRNSLNNTWLNYAVPIPELRESVDKIRSGAFIAKEPENTAEKPKDAADLARLGIELVPDVLMRTPPYVDHVRPGSPAAKAGLQPDDLILMLGDRLVQSCRFLTTELASIDAQDPIRLTVLRGQELVEFVLHIPSGNSSPNAPQGPPQKTGTEPNPELP